MVTHPPPSPSESNNNNNNGDLEEPTASVQVVVRLRPLSERELQFGTLPVISANTAERTVTIIKEHASLGTTKSTFKFDGVFTAFSTQQEVFEATLQPVLRDVLAGYESTVFAYGQTGTGKTFTMEGNIEGDEDEFGVIPRSATAIFEALENKQPDSLYKTLESHVTVSFLEIYNEELCDLLVTTPEGNNNGNPNSGSPMRAGGGGAKTNREKLVIIQGKDGPFCRGLSQQKVESAQQVLALMRQAQQQRQVSETNLNKQSSRSHCIFTITVQATRQSLVDHSVLKITGKLHCVDLAGSECAKLANIQGTSDPEQAARERERLNINRSLLTLGRVISMLNENNNNTKGKKNTRIPYRDSKLTRILQESLGGRCKTCLIATVSPSVSAVEESMSTLNYAQAANGIVNKPVNTSLLKHSGSGLSLTSTASSSLEKSDATLGTIEHWHEMEIRLQYMQTQVEEAQQALARMHMRQQPLLDRTAAAEEALEIAEQQVKELQSDKQDAEQKLQAKQEENEWLMEKLSTTQRTLEETMTALNVQVEENKQISALLASTQTKLSETEAALQDKVEENQRVSQKLAHTEQRLLQTEAAREAQMVENKRVSIQLAATEKTLQETTAVLRATQTTEQKLTHEAVELLRVLKDAVSESSSLHEQLVQQYKEDVQRKAATKDFARAILERLEAIGASTAYLRVTQQEFHSELQKIGGEFDEIQLKMSRENQESLESLSSQVTASIASIKKHLSEQLVATAISNGENVVKNVTVLVEQASTGMSTLTASCKAIGTTLDTAAERLGKIMTDDYQQSSAKLLQTLTKEVANTNEQIGDWVESLGNMLESARNARAENTKALRLLSENWKSFLQENSENIQALSNTRSQDIARILEMMTNEQQHCHQTVDAQLRGQQSFLKDSRNTQNNQLQEQNELLVSQKQTLQLAFEKQQELCNSIVSNVMAGVQELLKAEMGTLAQKQVQDYGAFVSSNEQLVVSNETLTSSTAKILDTMDDVNATLQNRTKQLSTNDSKAIAAFEETESITLHSINSFCVQQTTESNKFASRASTRMDTNETTDEDSKQQMIQNLSNGKAKLDSHLTDRMLQDTTNGVTELSNCVSDAFDFVQADFVDATKKAMDERVEQPITQVFSEMRKGLNVASSELQQGMAQLQSDANEQIANADSLDRDIVASKTVALSQKLVTQQEQVSNFNLLLFNLSQSNKNAADLALQRTERNAEFCTTSTGDYTQNTIAMDEETKPMPPPKEFVYSEDLSATAPSVAIIAQLWASKEPPSETTTMQVDKETHIQ